MSFLIDKECPRYLVLLATLNFVLCLYGYEFIATLGSPFMSVGSTQFITIPYRAVCLAISLFLIFRCRADRFRFTPAVVCLVIYWAILILRMVYDFYVQWDFDINAAGKQHVLLFFICINLPQTLSYALSWDKVDYGKAFRYLALMLVTIALLNIVFNPALLYGNALGGNENVTTDGRITGGAALNTISFAHCGVALSLISLYTYYYVKDIKRIFPVAFFCLGTFIMLKAGSRGPVAWFAVIMVLFYSFRTRQIIYAFLVFTLLLIVLYTFQDVLLRLIKDVSPVLYHRTMATLTKGDLSGRDGAFNAALRIWSDSPIIGKYFTIYYGTPRNPGYTHNVFYDSMIMGGMFGVAMMGYFYYSIVRSVYVAMKYSSVLVWIPLLMLQKYLACLSSGCFWSTSAMSVGLLCAVFLQPYFFDNEEMTDSALNL